MNSLNYMFIARKQFHKGNILPVLFTSIFSVPKNRAWHVICNQYIFV